MKITLSALCLTLFMSGCGKTETIIRTQEVAVLPPNYLYVQEVKPTVPAGLPPDKRTDHLLDAYASRGYAIERSNKRAELIRQWVEGVKRLYPESEEKPLDELNDLEAEPDDPE